MKGKTISNLKIRLPKIKNRSSQSFVSLQNTFK